MGFMPFLKGAAKIRFILVFVKGFAVKIANNVLKPI
jgi:hypothetical protein